MVDIVTHTMPAESEVHVARNFLTKILGSSMRRNDSCGPHPLHSTSADNPTPDVPKSETDSAAESAWHDSSHSKDYTSCWGQTSVRQGNVESVELPSQTFSKEKLLSNKPSGGAERPVFERGLNRPHTIVPGTADHSSPRVVPSTEGMFYRGSPNELRVPTDCHRYLQIPMGTGGRVSPCTEEHAGSKFSPTGRSNLGPLWCGPEKNLSTTPAPPPPLRSDSFTATRVHEKSLVGSFPEGFSAYPQQKSHCRGVDPQFKDLHTSNRGCEARHSYNSPPKKGFLHPYFSAEDHNSNQLNPDKLFSLSSTDVRQAQNSFTVSDESPFSLHPKPTCTPRTQSVGSYYRSLQDLPTNSGPQNPARTSTATAFDHNHEGQTHFRYYCITSQQPSLESSTSTQEQKRDEQNSEVWTTQGAKDKSFATSQKVTETKYPQPYVKLPENKSFSGRNKQSISASDATSRPLCDISKSTSRERERDGEKNKLVGKQQHSSYDPNHRLEQKNLISTHHQDGLWISKQEQNICPLKTPMLHSLTQESKKRVDKSIVVAKEESHHESTDFNGGKQGRRSDRYATSLRNEIQQKKAQLQKSTSATILTCSSDVEEDSVVWKSNETTTSSSDGSYTSTYKDHLKEAQAKVLKATSFMRSDLVLPGNESSMGQPPKKINVTRIGRRKRFPVDKKIHSFSEPDKINEVGVEDKTVGTFVNCSTFFEGSCKPNFQKPILKLSPTQDQNKLTRDSEGIHEAPFTLSNSQHPDFSAKEQQRLGTFAEYEATWNLQRKPPDRRTTGRYHSAENILDSGLEESSNTVYLHERSRSSPSADSYGQKMPPNQSAVEPSSENQQDSCVIRKQGSANISEPLTLNVLENEGRQRSRSDSREQSPLSSHLLQVPSCEHMLPKNKGLRVDTPVQLETSSSSGETEGLLSAPLSISTARVRTASPEPTQTPPRRSSPDRTEHLDRDTCSTEASEDSDSREVSSLVLPVLGSTSVSSQQNDDRSRTSANRTRSPSPLFYPQRPTDKLPSVHEADPHSCTLEETNTGGQKISVQTVCDSETETRNCEIPQTARLNTSNTEQRSSEDQSRHSDTALKPSSVSQQSEEDQKQEELARDIMGKDKSLVEILDQRKMKTTMDLMEGIFPEGEQILEGAQQRRRTAVKQPSTKTKQHRLEDSLTSSVSFMSSSSYYNTSAPKAELLIKMKDMQNHLEQQDTEDDLHHDLSSKKQELIDSLSKKLQVLREARASLLEDVQDNNVLGEEVEATVQSVCRPNELEKFRMFVGDLDKVVSLLLSLSGRLARVENALNSLEEDTSADEKKTLMEKRKLLIRQHEDAKELKENLDRREHLVYEILASYLSEEHLADYQHFVKMKSALLLEQRKLEDKIKLGEEQLKCLTDSLRLEQRLNHTAVC